MDRKCYRLRRMSKKLKESPRQIQRKMHGKCNIFCMSQCVSCVRKWWKHNKCNISGAENNVIRYINGLLKGLSCERPPPSHSFPHIDAYWGTALGSFYPLINFLRDVYIRSRCLCGKPFNTERQILRCIRLYSVYARQSTEEYNPTVYFDSQCIWENWSQQELWGSSSSCPEVRRG